MCRQRFLIGFFLSICVTITQARFTIRAQHGNITVRNGERARLEWYFSAQSTAVMQITMVNSWSSKADITKMVAYQRNGRFELYGPMVGRARISRPRSSYAGVVIEIQNVAISDSGLYRCRATLKSGTFVQNITTLNVLVPPRIDSRQTKLYRREDQNASLLCNLEAGNPRPLYFQWYRIGWSSRDRKYFKKELTRVKLRDYNLTYYIPNVKKNDIGKYRCEVWGRKLIDAKGQKIDGGSDAHEVELFVEYKPAVMEPPRNQSVLENSGVAVMTCKCDSNVPGDITYHWYKDNPTVQHEIHRHDRKWEGRIEISEDRTQLKFLRPGRELTTFYYCAGSNTLGTGLPRGAYLNVTYPPGPIEIPGTDGQQSINAGEGMNLTVKCFSDSNPPATYNWFKIVRTFLDTSEKELLLAGDHISGDLTLTTVDRNDTAKYICEAYNRPNRLVPSKIVRRQKEVKVTVIFGPRQTNFTINNRNYTYREVKQFSRVEINCNSHSEPAATYNIRMERDQTQLNRDPKKGYVLIKRINAEHDGYYSCAATNARTGKTEVKRMRLVVSIAPEAYDPVPDAKVLSEGSTVSIKCHATGYPAPWVFWQRWGVNITHNDSVIQTSYKIRDYPTTWIVKGYRVYIVDAIMKFTRIRYTDDGSYSCVFNNTGGIKNISGMNYQVQFPPKLRPTGYPENLTKLEGERARFSCLAFANPLPIQWKWLFNGKEIQNEVLNTFEVSYTKRVDNGKYQCVPRNQRGVGQIGTATLEVQYEPMFTLEPEKKYTRDRTQSLTLGCKAVGVPEPEIFWRKVADSTFLRKGTILSFDSLRPRDRGVYSCVARNVVKSKSVSTTIMIRHGPIITTNTPGSTKVGSNEGEHVALQCDVDAYPIAKVVWKYFRTDTPIKSGLEYTITEEDTSLFSKRSILSFTVKPYHLGRKFKCYAENILGRDDQEFQVLRRGRPDPPVRDSLKATDELLPTIPVTVNINLTWIPGYSGGAEVGFYLLYKESWERQYRQRYLKLTDGFKHVMTNMKPSTYYEFSMKAQNRFGVSQLYDPPTKFATKDSPPDVANVTYVRNGLDGTSVIISWFIYPGSLFHRYRIRRDATRKWSYGVVRYRIADVETLWREEKILGIPQKGSLLVENLNPEQLYVFHFILFDEQGYFGRPIMIGKFYPSYDYEQRSSMSQTELTAIGVGCGVGILIICIACLILILRKKNKSPYGNVAYSNARNCVDVPVSNVVGKETARASYYKAEEFFDPDEDIDEIATDSLKKSPPPSYNDVHNGSDLHASVRADDEPLINGSINHSDGQYENVSPQQIQKFLGNRQKTLPHYGSRDHLESAEKYSVGRNDPRFGSHDQLADVSHNFQPRTRNDAGVEEEEGSREHLSSAEKLKNTEQWNSIQHLSDKHIPIDTSPRSDISKTLNMSCHSINSDLQQAYKYAEKHKKKSLPYKSLDDSHESGRASPVESSVASSKVYHSDNEYIDENDENYEGQLV